MDDQELSRLLGSRSERTSRYRAAVVEYYDRVTDGYRKRWGDSFHLPVFFEDVPLDRAIVSIERRISAECGLGPWSNALDVGCGIGGPTLTLAEYSGARMTGVNIVSSQVAIAHQRAGERRLLNRPTFVVGDGMRLPFSDEAFDAVVVFESGCHMPDKAQFYRECARVLRVGGRFAGIDWMKADGLDSEREERYVEPICRLHAIAYLIDRAEFDAHLSMASLSIEVFHDLTTESGLTRAAASASPPADVAAISHVESWLSEGGHALARGAQAGAFKLCLWRATKAVPRPLTDYRRASPRATSSA
jgi:SAM-dependent methyltransferase